MVSTSAILLLLIIYLIPDNRKEIELKNKDVEYTYNNITDTIYLIDKNDYVSRTNIAGCNCSDIDKAKDLIAKKGVDEAYGARPLKRTIQTMVEDKIADAMLDGKVKGKINVTAKDDEIIIK